MSDLNTLNNADMIAIHERAHQLRAETLRTMLKAMSTGLKNVVRAVFSGRTRHA